MKPYLINGTTGSTAPQAVPPSGTVKNLVILCKFSNHTEGVHTRNPSSYDILFNQIGGDPTLAPTGTYWTSISSIPSAALTLVAKTRHRETE